MKKSGFIALISILIMSALMLLVGTGIVLRALGSSHIEVVDEQLARADAAATSCAEYALMQLKNSSSYPGNVTLNENGDTCTILPIGGIGGSIQTIQTTSTVSGATRKIVVTVSAINPSMNVTWQVVPSF